MRDTKSLLLVMLSVGLVSTWVYHLYDKTIYSNRRTEVYIKDSIAVAQAVRDSLQQMYTGTITELDTKLETTLTGADSLKNELGSKLQHIQTLKTEINKILGKKGVTDEELGIARTKISELQTVIAELRKQNGSMETEQQRLSLVMDQLNGDIRGLQQNMQRLGDENKQLTDKINLAAVFVASELRLNAVAVKGTKEEETNQAKKASKFVLSFLVQNNINEYSNTEVYVIVTGPDGQVLQNPVWESRTMDTKNEGKKDFTLRIRFDYNKGEAKRLLFSLNDEQPQKGTYVMEVYHNGYQIGRTTRILN
jgi:peptidoglycan hydrolase CwlO-like protein